MGTVNPENPELYINRELSLLEFNGSDFVRRLLFCGQFCLRKFRLRLNQLSAENSGNHHPVLNI